MVEIKTICCGAVICLGSSARNAVQNAARENISLAYADFRGIDLSHLFLEGLDLSYADLRGVDLRHTVLDEANLSYTNMTGADLRGSSMLSTNLYKADTFGVNFNGVNLDNLLPEPALRSVEELFFSDVFGELQNG